MYSIWKSFGNFFNDSDWCPKCWNAKMISDQVLHHKDFVSHREFYGWYVICICPGCGYKESRDCNASHD